MKPTIEIIKGVIEKGSNGEEEVLKVGRDILAEYFQELTEKHGRLISVRYYVSDKIIRSLEKANEDFIKNVMGFASADYCMRYSEITGYLWTDEELNVGGHNLLDELESSVGQYLMMEVTFHDEESFRLGYQAARDIAIKTIQGVKSELETKLKIPGINQDTFNGLQTGHNTTVEISSRVNRELEKAER